MADELLGVVGPLGGTGDADADGHEPAVRVRHAEALDGRAHAVAGERRRFERLLRQQDEELLAAVAVDGVAAAHGLRQRAAHAAQQGVALEVAGASL
jgi:hypothetical protein